MCGVGDIAGSCLLLLLTQGYRVHGPVDFAHTTHDSLKIASVPVNILEASTDEFSYCNHLLDLQPRDRIVEAVELEDAVGFAVVADNRREHEILDVLERLQVVAFGQEVALRHPFEVVVVDGFSLAECHASQSLIGGDADHLIAV